MAHSFDHGSNVQVNLHYWIEESPPARRSTAGPHSTRPGPGLVPENLRIVYRVAADPDWVSSIALDLSSLITWFDLLD